mgnify:FL=1
MNTTRRITLDVGATREPPSEFRIFRAGANPTTKGVLLFDEQAAESVMRAAQDWGNDFPLDYQHGMVAFLTPDPAASGAAAGWFAPEVRAGELWAANVRWTERAAGYLRAGEYRYISPTVTVAEDGRVLELINVALTNIPATKGLDPLVAFDRRARRGRSHARKTMNEETLKALRAALAEQYADAKFESADEEYVYFELPAGVHAEPDGDEEGGTSMRRMRMKYKLSDGVCSLEGEPEPHPRPGMGGEPDGDEAQTKAADPSPGSAPPREGTSPGAPSAPRAGKPSPGAASRSVLSVVAEVTGASDADAQVGKLLALHQRAQRVEALERELVTLRAEREATERRALLDAAQRAGKITPAQRKAFDAGKGFLATLSLGQLKAYLAEAIPAVTLGAQHTPPAPDASASAERPGAALVSLTEAEEKIIRLSGVSREQYLRTKSKTSTIPVAERPARG